MAEQELKVGDIVRLKSGGPKITVEQLGENYGKQQAWCIWFDGTKKMEGVFPPDALELA